MVKSHRLEQIDIDNMSSIDIRPPKNQGYAQGRDSFEHPTFRHVCNNSINIISMYVQYVDSLLSKFKESKGLEENLSDRF